MRCTVSSRERIVWLSNVSSTLELICFEMGHQSRRTMSMPLISRFKMCLRQRVE